VTFAGVVLAAGTASRFAGPPKQTARLGDRALVSHVAAAALDAGLDPVIVVLGHEADAVRAILDADLGPRPTLVPVFAPRYREGMAESLKTGVAALPANAAGAFILLADMPFVTPALLARIAAALGPEDLAAAPVWNGQRGNPVLLARRAFALVEGLSGDRGLGALLAQRPKEVALAAAADDACLRDIDTPGALSDARDR
jgi:molybdenum cofactor cytidylyltransferase